MALVVKRDAKEQEFNHLGVFRRGARLCAPTYEQFVGFI